MNRRIFALFIFLFGGFSIFIAVREHRFIETAQADLKSQADVISVNLWRFNLDATTIQVEFLSKLNDYRLAKVTDYSGSLFMEIEPVELTGFPKFLQELGLIRTAEFTSDIVYDDKKLGTITVEKYNLEIYDYLYLFVILSLFMILGIVLDRLNHINKNLGTIVEGKTETLKRSEESLHVTLNSIGEGILAVDENGLVVRINSVAEKILNITLADCFGRSIPEIVNTSDSSLINLFQSSAAEKQNTTGTITVDSNLLTISATSSPIIDNEGRKVGIVYVLSDITEKIKAEENLKHSQKMESIGRLAGGVAHDFNNMLGGILGAAELLKEYVPHKNLDLLSLITESAERASGLTGKLLAFSRKGRVESECIDVHSAVNSAVSILSHSVSKKIRIASDLRAEQHCVLGDISQLQNCILNLGINASHAIEDTGIIEFSTHMVKMTPEFAAERSISLQPGMYIQITVKDTGSGISPANLKKIFEPFFTTKEQGKGTGLGLAAVHGTVLEHNGAVTVESELNVGTSFHIYLPLTQQNQSGSEVPAHAVPHQLKMGTVLLIDDEPVMRETAKLHLQKAGFSVFTACDGREGVSRYLENRDRVSLVIVDMIMPIMDGRETLKALKEINEDLPVILTSGFSRSGDFEDLRKIGFYDVLSKPYQIKELLNVCSSALTQQLSKS